jgi:hypothetical protein
VPPINPRGGANKLVDRVYQGQIPALRSTLERLKRDFSNLNPRSNWTRLRVDPLLAHARQLEKQLRTMGSARLTKGVSMFHSDLVYLRQNVSDLKRMLAAEQKAARRSVKPRAGGPD